MSKKVISETYTKFYLINFYTIKENINNYEKKEDFANDMITLFNINLKIYSNKKDILILNEIRNCIKPLLFMILNKKSYIKNYLYYIIRNSLKTNFYEYFCNYIEEEDEEQITKLKKFIINKLIENNILEQFISNIIKILNLKSINIPDNIKSDFISEIIKFIEDGTIADEKLIKYIYKTSMNIQK